MAYCLETYLEGKTVITKNPDERLIFSSLQTLWDYRFKEYYDTYGFVILSSDSPDREAQFVQVAQTEGEREQSLEIRFENSNRFRQYHKQTKIEETRAAFDAFFHEKKVDISGWEDWTDQLR